MDVKILSFERFLSLYPQKSHNLKKFNFKQKSMEMQKLNLFFVIVVLIAMVLFIDKEILPRDR